jgi:hypothetical protein
MNVIVESFLYYDHEKKICEDIYMCKKEKWYDINIIYL